MPSKRAEAFIKPMEEEFKTKGLKIDFFYLGEYGIEICFDINLIEDSVGTYGLAWNEKVSFASIHVGDDSILFKNDISFFSRYGLLNDFWLNKYITTLHKLRDAFVIFEKYATMYRKHVNEVRKLDDEPKTS